MIVKETGRPSRSHQQACSSHKPGKDGEQRHDEVRRTHMMLPILLRRIQIYSIQRSSFCCPIFWTDFVFILFGPSLAAERHSKDDQTMFKLSAQLLSRPLHNSSPVLSSNTFPTVQDEYLRLDSGKTYSVTTQLNFILSQGSL